jgi:hypothetical protein
LPGEEALSRKPSCGPDEFALEFDQAYTAFIAGLEELPTDSQLQSLQNIDAALSAMSGPSNKELWTESAMKNHPRWAELRVLAREAVDQFGWPRS